MSSSFQTISGLGGAPQTVLVSPSPMGSFASISSATSPMPQIASVSTFGSTTTYSGLR